MYAIYLFQQAFDVLQLRLRLGARVAALRDHQRRHADPDRRQPPVRLLRGQPADERRRRAVAGRVRIRPPRWRRRHRRSARRRRLAAEAAAGSRRRCYFAGARGLQRSSSSTRSSGSLSASLKPRRRSFDNRLIPALPAVELHRSKLPRAVSAEALQRRAVRALALEQHLDQRPRRAHRHVLERARRVRVRVLPLPAAQLPLRRACSRR